MKHACGKIPYSNAWFILRAQDLAISPMQIARNPDGFKANMCWIVEQYMDMRVCGVSGRIKI